MICCSFHTFMKDAGDAQHHTAKEWDGVSDMHKGHRERMRQRYLNGGSETFADHELLELLLFYATPRVNVNPTAHKLLAQFGSLQTVLLASADELKTVDGIGESAAILLTLVRALSRRITTEIPEPKKLASCPRALITEFMERFLGEPLEHFYVACLDQHGKVLLNRCLNDGSVSFVEVNLRKIIEHALYTKASCVVLAHNHPSGYVMPSEEDIAITNRTQRALREIGVALLDHIIVSGHDYLSLRKMGYLKG